MADRNYLPQFMERCKPYSSKTRKPPGGDTNDIFGLEERQKEDKMAIYEKKGIKKTAISGDKFLRKHQETEDFPSPRYSSRKLRRSSSESRNKSDGSAFITSPLASGKENIHSNVRPSPESKMIISEDKKLGVSESEDDDEKSASKKQLERNPTAEEIITNVSAQGELGDSTNIPKDENTASVQLKPPRRPCIRIRQPPGGKSSIIF